MLLVAASLAIVLGLGAAANRFGAWYLLVIYVPTAPLAVLTWPVLWKRGRRWLSERLRAQRPLLVSIASAGAGVVFVAVAVLVGTVDATAWDALAAAGALIDLLVVPMVTWSAAVALVAWVYLGCLAHAFAPASTRWDPLRETAAVVAVSAGFMLPLMMPLVLYQIWRLVDINIVSTAIGG
ncbi:MAG: hypothetical protein F4Y40_00675 [Acidimicrobiia bacterium]|nr:hypothetical protein [Acidimicrobiia bacterium]